MRYDVASYQCLLFDDVGHKIRTESADSYDASRVITALHCDSNPEYSAVINRTIYSSKNSGNKWEYKENIE